MVDDQPQASSSATLVSPADLDPKVIPPEESANIDTNRPVSTIPADSASEPQTSPADLPSDYTAPQPSIQADSPETTQSANMANQSTVPADSPTIAPSDQPESSVSASLADSQKEPPAESPILPTAEPIVTEPIAPPAQIQPPEPSQPSTPSNPSEPVSGGSVKDLPSSNQSFQVQPEPQESTSGVQPSEEPKTALESAGIKPEVPEGTQEAPSADSEAPKSSFGDIMYGTGRPSVPQQESAPPEPPKPPTPVVEPSPPKSSFGDLTDSKPPIEPTINIEPVEPPSPPITPIPPITPSPSPPSQPSDDNLKAEAETRRQKATQIRKQKRDANLAKVLGFIAQKGKVNNRDVRDFLHVSQTTATEYLHSLVKDGKLKKEGKGKATVYLF